MSPRPQRFFAALAAAACLAGGCIRPGLPPPVDMRVAGVDVAGLKHKTIVIDPGHGGPERGAVAQNGLEEAEVNLGVALYLWGYLKEAGASPLLTRTADTALYTAEPFVLRRDLEMRAAFANSRTTDLFVSVHHNSDGKERGDRNDLIMFYKMADPGCSRDAARRVCAALQKQLSAEPASTRPGNYLVLRATRAPAILGEASYMNYKKNSEKLAFHRTLAAEARGYFLGIARYFAPGVPAIAFDPLPAGPLETARPVISARISPGAPGAALDRGSLRASLNGAPVGFSAVDPGAGTVSCSPDAPLANGGHELCIEARNTAGNAAPRSCLSFTVALPPARVTARPVFATVPADGRSEAPVDITVLDSLGRPVRDGTAVELSATAGTFAGPPAVTVNGRARAFLTADSEPRQARVTVRAGDAEARSTVAFGRPREALFMATIRDRQGAPVPGAALVRSGSRAAVSDDQGRVYDSVNADGPVTYTIRQPGYEPLKVRISLSRGRLVTAGCTLRPVAGGVFFNRTVMLDAAGASPALLPLLRELKARIERAGGTALLTWQRPPAPGLQARVMQAARARADLFISLAGGGPPAARYYYKSERGELLARAACDSLNRRRACGPRACAPEPGTDYVLVQTSMPALLLRLPAAASPPARNVAACLYDAIRQVFAQPPAGR